MSMSCEVAPQGCMALQEALSVQVDFSTVLNLGDFRDTTFTLSVGWKCKYCTKREFESLWPTDIGWCCQACAPATRPSKFHSDGCSYTDTEEKATQHEELFCPYGTWCTICKKHVTKPRERHYESAHSDMTYKADVVWRAPIVFEETNFIITSDLATLWCDYVLNESLSLFISSIHTEHLLDYECFITVTNPATHVVPLPRIIRVGNVFSKKKNS